MTSFDALIWIQRSLGFCGMTAWRRGRETAFGCFASFQNRVNSPYGDVELACHFLPGPTLSDGSATALFVGSTRVLDRWLWDDNRMPQLFDAEIVTSEYGRREIEAFDLEWIEKGHDYCERVLINWGTGTRAWSQWPIRNPKQIIELRRSAQDPPFPGFSRFSSRISELSNLPASWIGALKAAQGVYLLVTNDGEQYVGSATGSDGFLGRWRAYEANGHGENVLLKQRGHRDYTVSILEIASPDMAPVEVLTRETHWKEKLGVRAHGLNAN